MRLSRYEYAVRLAAALQWAAPQTLALDLNGEPVPEYTAFQAGQWVRVPYRRSTRWALLCHVEDHSDAPAALLRDQTGRLYHLPLAVIQAANAAPWPPWLAGPIAPGMPESPRLLWHADPPPDGLAPSDAIPQHASSSSARGSTA